jgi:phospholipid/cholesterol/gamma-HCH transport system substrate-binding protein
VPGQQEVRWSQLKVGVLVIVALCALLALVFLMTNSSGGFWSGHLVLRSYFENSAGLKEGAPVTLEGVTVGNVSGIHIIPNRKPTPVEVTMRINKKYEAGIREDSKTSLTTQGVLGDTLVDIDMKYAHGGPRRLPTSRMSSRPAREPSSSSTPSSPRSTPSPTTSPPARAPSVC